MNTGFLPKAATIRAHLRTLASPATAKISQSFFKTGPGEYGEGDRFIGIRVPVLRQVAREFGGIALAELPELIRSPIHEARLLALIILVNRFALADAAEQGRIYRLYLKHTRFINNWDLVDTSAPQIVGGYLEARPCAVLFRLAKSKLLWERRIAVLATFHLIRCGDYAATLRLARMLLRDPHDLMHKAVGWMLREIGKRDVAVLRAFLQAHATQMPRTMLRYAIEKFSTRERQRFLRAVQPKLPLAFGARF